MAVRRGADGGYGVDGEETVKVGDVVMVNPTGRQWVVGLIIEPDSPAPDWWLVRLKAGYVSAKRGECEEYCRAATCADLRDFGVTCEKEPK